MTITTTRKWGNSIGVILPKEMIEEQKLKPNERVEVIILREANIKHLFGSLPRKKGMTGQKFKDLARSGWEK